MNTLVRLNHRLNPACAPYALGVDDLLAGFLRPIQDATREAGHPIKIDVSEDASAYRVAAVLPGVKKEDIHVSVDQNEVTIGAEVKRETELKDGEKILRSERVYGKSTRVFALGQDIDEAAVQAKYADGILSLLLPKKAPVSAKRVTIE
jgi:HSP20 family protein